MCCKQFLWKSGGWKICAIVCVILGLYVFTAGIIWKILFRENIIMSIILIIGIVILMCSCFAGCNHPKTVATPENICERQTERQTQIPVENPNDAVVESTNDLNVNGQFVPPPYNISTAHPATHTNIQSAPPIERRGLGYDTRALPQPPDYNALSFIYGPPPQYDSDNPAFRDNVTTHTDTINPSITQTDMRGLEYRIVELAQSTGCDASPPAYYPLQRAETPTYDNCHI
ncbi:unnamed protein product [Owenia fusiformis]|uniref:Uncharacterized protein n=1 Tax=Owenia fusiformis TaxID=6347 RepID=A0A8J1Y198_OWEFU|nr:unnamed protein product [Owenia fusiformis]